MQVVNCSVRLGSNLNSVVRKTGVTVAEILVLRAIHGADSVVDIQRVMQDKRSRSDEMDRLLSLYSASVVKGVFPGANPSLPADLSDVGIDPATCAQAVIVDRRTNAQKANAAGGKKPAESDAAVPSEA